MSHSFLNPIVSMMIYLGYMQFFTITNNTTAIFFGYILELT